MLLHRELEIFVLISLFTHLGGLRLRYRPRFGLRLGLRLWYGLGTGFVG